MSLQCPLCLHQTPYLLKLMDFSRPLCFPCAFALNHYVYDDPKDLHIATHGHIILYLIGELSRLDFPGAKNS